VAVRANSLLKEFMDYHLGDIEAADVDAYVRHFADKTISDNLLMVPFPYTRDDAIWWVRHVAESPARKMTNRAIRNSEGELIGAIGVAGDLERGSHRVEIGYWLASGHRGKGIMGAAIVEFCDFLFSEFRVGRIFATPFAGNASSHRVLEKAGFLREGLARSYHRKGAEIIDAVIYAKIEGDPREPLE
jgi:RimJ/RimL family protein N-acetyltransferase